MPIKTDEGKTKAFHFGSDSSLKYEITTGGKVDNLQWPESRAQICVGDAPLSQLSGGRCLELLIINKSKSGNLLTGSTVKTVLGCIRLGSTASFDSTERESAVWSAVLGEPDRRKTVTLPLRPDDGTLLNSLFNN